MDSESTDETTAASGEAPGPLRIELDYDRYVNFALQQNAVPVVKRLAITNSGDETLTDLTITVVADPDFAPPWSARLAALAPGDVFVREDLDLALSPGYLAALEERLRGRLTLQVTAATTRATHAVDCDLLAYNEWAGLQSLPEILAAFIQPNHRALAPILRRTADLLAELPGGGSITGYQSRSARYVQAQCAALYRALQELGIAYINPPASFELSGQKIRLANDLLDDRLGTCLDLTVLMAACLEQMGLHPLVILLRGHCFPGVWLTESDFPYACVDDAVTIAKRLDLDEMMVFEATALTGAEPLSFDRAVAEGKRLLDDRDRFQLAIDIHRARISQIRPMASRVAAAEMLLEVAPAPARAPASAAPNRDYTLPSEPVAESAETRLDRWRRRLLDLSMNNRMLNFRATSKVARVLSHDLGQLEDTLAGDRHLKVLAKPAEFGASDPRRAAVAQARDGDDPLSRVLEEQLARGQIHTDLTDKRHATVLTEIFRSARNNLEEGGVSCLYLAVGFLAWYESDASDRTRLAPLLLIPVELHRRSARHGFELSRGEDEPVVNTALLEKLRLDFELDIHELRDLPMDDAGVDVARVLHVIKKAIRDVPRWEVREDAWLGFFSFQKFLMWRDLQERAEKLTENAVVGHLVHTPSAEFRQDAVFPVAAEMDVAFPPSAVYCPRDADGSQLRAVLAAADGANFVLKGPPGTGKSQTITNLIAHALASGKTVLFVSEKMAALNVVHERLKTEGLEDFCAELHSNKAQKRAFIEGLHKTYQLTARREPEEWSVEAERLQALRNQLNAYVTALHRPQPNGLTAFTALSRLSPVRDVPRVRLSWPAPDTHDAAALQRLTEAVEKLRQDWANCGDVAAHPWRLSRETEWSASWRDQVADAVADCQAATDALAAVWQDAAKLLASLDVSASPAGLALAVQLAELLVDAPQPARELLTTTDWSEATDRVAGWLRTGRERDALRETARAAFTDAILDAQIPPLREAVREAREAFILIRWLKAMNAKKLLQPYLVSPVTDLTPVDGWLATATDWQTHEAALTAAAEPARQLLGRHWQPETSDWQAAERIVEWTGRLRGIAAAAADGDLARARTWRTAWADTVAELHEELAADRSAGRALSALKLAHDSWRAQLQALAKMLRIDAESLLGSADGPPPWETLPAILREWAAIDRLREWCFLQSSRQDLVSAGLTPLLAAVDAGEFGPEELPSRFERSYLQWWYEAYADATPILRDFKGYEHERLISQFREIDGRFMSLTRQLIVARLSAQVPQSSRDPNRDSEAGILVREAQKKSRHLSIRRLIGELETLLPRLKPCLLMSPISVAQYLDANYPPFDLVIFDEASQIPVWDAIGSIARGRSCVVVGDPKQLPPTTFFDRADGDDVLQDNEIEELESILDECIAARLPTLTLDWHYRSQHEHLIAFSNYQYYENRLILFPAALRDGLGVTLHPVPDGVYDRGRSSTNKGEAEAIVAAVIERLQDPERRHYSIGVVTFSMAQSTLIEDLLDAARQEHPELEPFFAGSDAIAEPVFVKNLESVQGDERDVILFSVCYGPDRDGRVAMNFGPLNRVGGERRLNVAMTRARREVHIYSTLRWDQINLARTKAVGVKDLRLYLQYAERGPSVLGGDTLPGSLGDYESPFERDVAVALRARGWELHPQVGCAGYRLDLAVVDPAAPGRYMAGIECDGAMYHSSHCARDRDKLREGVLRSLGWEILRVWSTDWWENPDKQVDRLHDALTALRDGPTSEPRRGANDPSLLPPADVDAAESTIAEELPPLEPLPPPCPYYLPATLTGGAIDSDGIADNATAIKRDIRAVVSAEWPVSEPLLLRRLADAWDFRLTAKVRGAFLDLVKAARLQAYDSGGTTFYLPRDTTITALAGCRIPDPEAESTRRDIDDISLEELGHAAQHILHQQGSIHAKPLAKEVATLMGFGRLTAKSEERIMLAIDRLMEDGVAG